MKSIISLIVIFCTSFMFSQTEEEQKAWQEYMTPSEIHKFIAKSDGEWLVENKMWMEPGTPMIESKGTCTNEMVLDGRYQKSTYKSEFMGMPMNGIGYLAFDNAKKEFISTWIDNFGTGIMVLKGTFDASTNAITLTGKMVDPLTGKDIDVKEIFTFVTKDHQKMEMFADYDGKEFKSMELNFYRVTNEK